MSLFPEFEKPAQIFHSENKANHTTDIDSVPDATVQMFIIPRIDTEFEVMGDEIAQYVAFPSGDQRSVLLQGSLIICEGKKYKIDKEPTYLALMDKTRVLLKHKSSKK